jgi:hypothetical protein
VPLECEARRLVCGQTRKELRHRLKTVRLQATVKLGGLKQLLTQRARRSRSAPCLPSDVTTPASSLPAQGEKHGSRAEISDQVIRKPGEPGHRNIGRGSCRSALADGVHSVSK